MKAVEKFWSRTDRRSDNECWLFDKGIGTEKYGRIWTNGETLGAHRFSYMLHKGPIPDGADVCHTCDTPRCVNPAHLFVGSRSDNMRDMVLKGRHARKGAVGNRNSNAKLDAEKVRIIRLGGKTDAQLARELGVTKAAVRHVRIGRTWSHVA